MSKLGKKNTNDAPTDSALSNFAAKCAEAVEGDNDDVEDLCEELTKLVPADELQTRRPVKALFEPLLAHCRGKDDEAVLDTVKRFAPLVSELIKEADQWRFKVNVLIEVMRIAVDMGLPRLSPKSALLEVVFDGLYLSEVIEEQYFDMWSLHEDVNIH